MPTPLVRAVDPVEALPNRVTAGSLDRLVDALALTGAGKSIVVMHGDYDLTGSASPRTLSPGMNLLGAGQDLTRLLHHRGGGPSTTPVLVAQGHNVLHGLTLADYEDDAAINNGGVGLHLDGEQIRVQQARLQGGYDTLRVSRNGVSALFEDCALSAGLGREPNRLFPGYDFAVIQYACHLTFRRCRFRAFVTAIGNGMAGFNLGIQAAADGPVILEFEDCWIDITSHYPAGTTNAPWAFRFVHNTGSQPDGLYVYSRRNRYTVQGRCAALDDRNVELFYLSGRAQLLSVDDHVAIASDAATVRLATVNTENESAAHFVGLQSNVVATGGAGSATFAAYQDGAPA